MPAAPNMGLWLGAQCRREEASGTQWGGEGGRKEDGCGGRWFQPRPPSPLTHGHAMLWGCLSGLSHAGTEHEQELAAPGSWRPAIPGRRAGQAGSPGKGQCWRPVSARGSCSPGLAQQPGFSKLLGGEGERGLEGCRPTSPQPPSLQAPRVVSRGGKTCFLPCTGLS